MDFRDLRISKRSFKEPFTARTSTNPARWSTVLSMNMLSYPSRMKRKKHTDEGSMRKVNFSNSAIFNISIGLQVQGSPFRVTFLQGFIGSGFRGSEVYVKDERRTNCFILMPSPFRTHESTVQIFGKP